MATVVKRTLACDKCGGENGVQRYSITFPKAGRRTCDLCVDDRVPLDELERLYEKKPTGRKVAARVMSEADIARQKRSRKQPGRAKSRKS